MFRSRDVCVLIYFQDVTVSDVFVAASGGPTRATRHIRLPRIPDAAVKMSDPTLLGANE